jgi:hypothetical protein
MQGSSVGERLAEVGGEVSSEDVSVVRVVGQGGVSGVAGDGTAKLEERSAEFTSTKAG